MTSDETPLVAFTLLAQAAAGAAVTLASAQLASWWGPGTGPDLLALATVVPVGLLLGAGVFFSLMHLGAPRHAAFAMANWRTSWLSREILSATLFGLALAGHGLLLILRWAAVPLGDLVPGLRATLVVLTCLGAVALVLSMARVYGLPTTPDWHPVVTGLAFAGSALLLGGSLAVLAALLLSRPDGVAPAVGAVLGCATLTGLGLELWADRTRVRSRAGARVGALRARPARSSAPWPRVGLVAGTGLAVMALLLSAVAPLWASAGLAVAAIAVAGTVEARRRQRFYQVTPGHR